MDKPIRYSDAGVDIDTQDRLVASLAEKVEGIGGFSGVFPFNLKGYTEPLLVASTDGVGTKLLVAIEAGRLNTVGIDLVAMVINDLACCGAKPLFFLDYFATSKLTPEQWKPVLEGIMEGCRQAGCVLLGGETAEMPGLYGEKHFDLAGFGVGAVDRSKALDGKSIQAGDMLIGIASNGLHSNGYSLVRRILFERCGLALTDRLDGETDDVADVLLRPTRIYTAIAAALHGAVDIRAFAHITGGGLPDNIRRLLPEGVSVEIDSGSWPVPNVFQQLQKLGPVERNEMFRTFNMGIGLVAIVPGDQAERALDICSGQGETAFRIGQVVAGTRNVQIS